MSNAVATIHEAPPRLPSIATGNRILAIVPSNLDEAWRIANVAFKGGICPTDCKSAENAMTRVLHGMEVGLPPMASIQSIAVINGRPVIWGDAAIGLVRASGKAEYIREFEEVRDNTLTAVCITQRIGEPEPTERTWSAKDEATAGLADKDIHKKFPKRMRQMRARAFCLRDTYADVLKGLAIREEVEDIQQVQVEDGPPPPPPVIASPPVAQIEHRQEVAAEPEPERSMAALYEDSAPAGEVVWEDEKAPATDGPPDPLEIPGFLDRRAPVTATAADVFDPAQWLKDLDAALSGCEDMMTLGEEWNRLAKPHQKIAFPPDWSKAVATFKTHSNRIGRSNLDAG